MNPSTVRIFKSILNVVFTIVELLLFGRFLLRLLGANSAVDFVSWVYDFTYPLVVPFTGVFPNPIFDGKYVVEFNTLFAWIVYMLIFFVLLEVLNVFKVRRRDELDS